jgi:molybdate transport system substrate-binding protein
MAVCRMRRVSPMLCLFLLLAVVAFAPNPSHATTVFAAASLKDVLEELAASFAVETGAELTLSFGGSSILARQIEFGAPADLFISANVAWMDWLEERQLIKSATRVNLVGNRLVLVAHQSNLDPIALTDGDAIEKLLGDGRLVMALVEAVPAGIYGKSALSSLGVWDQLEDNVAQTDNVRAAVTLVATGEAPLGVVYASDALSTERVHVIAEFPADSHAQIVYPVAEITVSRDPVSRELLSFLRTKAAQTVFARHGFTLPGQ